MGTKAKSRGLNEGSALEKLERVVGERKVQVREVGMPWRGFSTAGSVGGEGQRRGPSESKGDAERG